MSSGLTQFNVAPESEMIALTGINIIACAGGFGRADRRRERVGTDLGADGELEGVVEHVGLLLVVGEGLRVRKDSTGMVSSVPVPVSVDIIFIFPHDAVVVVGGSDCAEGRRLPARRRGAAVPAGARATLVARPRAEGAALAMRSVASRIAYLRGLEQRDAVVEHARDVEQRALPRRVADALAPVAHDLRVGGLGAVDD